METILLYTDLEAILFLFLSLLLIIQICYYTLLYNKVNRYNRMKAVKQVTDELPPLSVIICARDQAESLRQNLPSILEQDYPNFELIVINDGSTDESENLLKRFSAKYSHLYHTFTPSDSRYLSRKKLSMTLGIKASKNPWLVFTEANCVPSSNQWLRLMARNFTTDTQIVLGYSNCQSIDGWLNKRVVFNLFLQSLRDLGLAQNGEQYMRIGKNMAYGSELCFEAKGYAEYLN